MTTRASLDVDSTSSAATRARRFARDTLRGWQLTTVELEVELVTTELVTNAVLHGTPPILLELRYEQRVVRVEVADSSPARPLLPTVEADSMTGRGLALVGSIAARWGVEHPTDGRGRKLVWAEIATDAAAPAESSVDLAGLWSAPESELDAELALEAFDTFDGTATGPAGGRSDGAEPRYTVVLGDVPTNLLMAAKAHVDNVVRELTLAAYDAESEQGPQQRDTLHSFETRSGGSDTPMHLRGVLATLLRDVVTGFAEVRQQIKQQAMAAATRGEQRTRLELRVGASMAEAAERYLAALEEVDQYARAARLLTFESPPEHQAFRNWYVRALVCQLRALARGEVPPPPQTFEEYLLKEFAHGAAAREAGDRTARLHHVTAALAGALTPSDVANVAVGECLAALRASAAALVLRDDVGRPLLVASAGISWPAAMALAEEVLAGERAIWREVSGGRPEAGACCAVPIVVAGELLGVLGMSFAGAALFDEELRAFLAALAAQVGQSISRTRLHAASVEAADRLARLHRVTAELARHAGVAEVGAAAVRCVAESVGAMIVALSLPAPGPEPDRVSLRLADVVGAPVDERFWMFPVDAELPASEAFRTGSPVVVESTGERDRRYPALAGLLPVADHLLACLPLRVDDGVLGVLSMTFAAGNRVDAARLDFLTALADVCAQAVSRAQALDRAASAQQRFAFLAEASRRLADSLDYNKTLQTVVELAVPQLADWCGIDLLDGSKLEPVAAAHADPAVVALARQIRALYPQSPESWGGVRAVVASGRTRLVPVVTEEVLAASAIDERHLAMMRDLRMSAVLIAPLSVGGRVLGALSLFRTDPRRPFSADEIALVEDVGRRAGTAIENARFFSEISRARHSKAGTDSARLELALESAAIGSFDWDLSEGGLAFDHRLCAIFGWEPSEFDGRVETLRDAMADADEPAFQYAVQRSLRRLDDFNVEFRFRRRDGAMRWLDARGRVLPGPDGRAGRVIGIAFDSTELREARDRVARTLEHMGDAFFSLDDEWRITYVNTAGEQLLGRDRSLLLGRTLWTAFPGAAGGLFDRECQRVLETGQPVTFSHYLDSTDQHVEVRVQPLPDGLGVYVTDVSRSLQYEQETAQLREASQQARSQAAVARSRLAFVAEASADLATTLDPDEVCRRLANHAVGRLADWVSIYIVDGEFCRRAAATHRDPGRARVVAKLVDAFPVRIGSNAMVAEVARTGRPILDNQMSAQAVYDTYPDPVGRALVEGIGAAAAFVTPMVARNEVVGVIAFVRADGDYPFEPDEVQLAATLASRAALAVQNAQLYARQTTVAQALQQAVLPEALPRIGGLELAARYEPAVRGAGVGGDFYDAFRLRSGRVALAVGDAAGHGLGAGALMGQLRNALRAYAFEERGPSDTLRGLSALISSLEPDAFGTAFYAELDPSSGHCRWASAGHPPPLLVPPDEPPSYLDGQAAPPLGVLEGMDADGEFILPPGGGILMYTDGLVERRSADITDGLEALRILVEKHSRGPAPSGANVAAPSGANVAAPSGANVAAPSDANIAASLDAVIDGMRGDTGFGDDVCALFAVRVS